MRIGSLFSNTIGHCAGIAVFSLLSYLFLVDWKRSRRLRSGLSAVAAALGLIWNTGDLLALDPSLLQGPAFHVAHAFAFSALSFLPAVLLHIWLERRDRHLRMSGYFLSFAAAALQARAELTQSFTVAYHAPSLFIAIGFSGLTIICLRHRLRQSRLRRAGGHLATAMLLLLPSICFASNDALRTVNVHLIGIPLSIFAVLFDFRFLILDVFSRFFVRTFLATCGAALSIAAALKLHHVAQNPFRAALAFAGVLAGLLATIQLPPFVDRLTAWFWRRQSRLEPFLALLRDDPEAERSDDEYLDHARCTIAAFFQCQLSEVRDLLQFPELEDCPGPAPLVRSRRPILNAASWVEAALPLRFSSGDGRVLLLGPRRGHRPYQSEDFISLARFGKIIEEHVEHKIQLQTQALASQAELRALQAQINPHFFFNSLNTLYAAISRDNVEARRLVLNLAEIFHYLLRSDRTFVSLKQELAIINAYLEIEKLRLGTRLSTSIQIDDNLLEAEIPVLSIQPLVENAVKHGVAPCSNNGFVGLTVKSENVFLKIEVANSGKFRSDHSLNGAGVGLDNVQRRLALCYGQEAELCISSKENSTLVCCSMPLSIPLNNNRPKPVMDSAALRDIMRKTA